MLAEDIAWSVSPPYSALMVCTPGVVKVVMQLADPVVGESAWTMFPHPGIGTPSSRNKKLDSCGAAIGVDAVKVANRATPATPTAAFGLALMVVVVGCRKTVSGSYPREEAWVASPL